ncbi:MAG: enoyl-CoA hydratase/isomerase family protein [Amaricoccus sp.]
MSDVLIRVEGRAGRITLERPRALNALSFAMVGAIDAALQAWEVDPAVALVLIDGVGERAFCAGADIAETYHLARRGDFAGARAFWGNEYRMDARIARYPKPYVALMHGYTMGGGVGVSGHGSHRIVGESARVAMPECGIGLVPDIGGTQLLAAAPGRLGEYLGLTSDRMTPGDAIHAGFADVLVPEAEWPGLVADLVATGDVGAIAPRVAPVPEPPLAALREAIDDAFAAVDLAALIARLEATDWGHGVLKVLATKSPLSMACTLELVRAARREPGVEKALRREHRFAWRSATDGDLLEGIRATVIDKDRKPVWRDALDGVRPEQVAAMLAPLGDDDLTF